MTRHDLRHLENGTIEMRLEQISSDIRTRQPTRDEHCTFELYFIELKRRGQLRNIDYYHGMLSNLRYRAEKHGYADPLKIKPECGA